MYAVVNDAGDVFYGEGTKPAVFAQKSNAIAVAQWFSSSGHYGALKVVDR